LRELQRVVAAHDPDLLAVCADDAQLGGGDLFVTLDALYSWGSDASYLQDNAAAARNFFGKPGGDGLEGHRSQVLAVA
jgi:hypothetical protein